MNEPRQSRYNDIYVRIALSLISAHFIVTFGEKETFFELLVMPYYYVSVLGSAIIAFLVISLVRYISILLDRRFDWKERTPERIALQVCAGIAMPIIAAFLLANFYFMYFGIDIHETLYLQYDFPFVAIFIVAINGYYIAYYFYSRYEDLSSGLADKMDNSEVPDGEAKTVQTFIVSKGTRRIAIPLQQIGYFFRGESFNMLRSTEGEDFMVPQTLEEIEQILPEVAFFRANRRVIVSRTACRFFEPLEHNKLRLEVSPPLKEDVVISQKRSRSFRDWFAATF
ncbi:LytTR family DNA-binding domain-containing protein [Pedobacter sp. UBA4863]|uniref:LytTR family DNA-binding domain-containing protein n=1 Tax=Pedobacter sp. UBA4863 TaxID=1947060 RepID=UPI0025FF0EA2|nr:LytTR family DNA-binding domain-containing protein [Pedobacter sp. UBA4863]